MEVTRNYLIIYHDLKKSEAIVSPIISTFLQLLFICKSNSI